MESKNNDLTNLLTKASDKIQKKNMIITNLMAQKDKPTNNKTSEQEQIQQYKIHIAQYENVVREQEEQIKSLSSTKLKYKNRIKEMIQAQQDSANQEKEIPEYQKSELMQMRSRVHQIEIENKTLLHQNEALQNILKKYNEIESENLTLHESTNRLEQENKNLKNLLDESNEKIKAISEQYSSMTKSVNPDQDLQMKEHLAQINELQELNKMLQIELKKEKSQTQALQFEKSNLEEKIKNLEFVALEQEKLRNDIKECEAKLQDKERKEQNLTKKYHYYKEKAKKQIEVINNFHTKTNDINHELEMLREREARKEAALRRQNRNKVETDANLVKMSRELFEEKTKNIRLNSKLHRAQLQENSVIPPV